VVHATRNLGRAGQGVDHVPRSHLHLLQQGRFVADIVYYYGEDSNVRRSSQPIRRRSGGYNFDYANSDVVKNRLTVSPAGLLTTATGMSYRVLALDPNSQRMPLAVLRKIRDNRNAGRWSSVRSRLNRLACRMTLPSSRRSPTSCGAAPRKGKVLTGSIGDALASAEGRGRLSSTRSRRPTPSWHSCTASWPTATSTG